MVPIKLIIPASGSLSRPLAGQKPASQRTPRVRLSNLAQSVCQSTTASFLHSRISRYVPYPFLYPILLAISYGLTCVFLTFEPARARCQAVVEKLPILSRHWPSLLTGPSCFAKIRTGDDSLSVWMRPMSMSRHHRTRTKGRRALRRCTVGRRGLADRVGHAHHCHTARPAEPRLVRIARGYLRDSLTGHRHTTGAARGHHASRSPLKNIFALDSDRAPH